MNVQRSGRIQNRRVEMLQWPGCLQGRMSLTWPPRGLPGLSGLVCVTGLKTPHPQVRTRHQRQNWKNTSFSQVFCLPGIWANLLSHHCAPKKFNTSVPMEVTWEHTITPLPHTHRTSTLTVCVRSRIQTVPLPTSGPKAPPSAVLHDRGGEGISSGLPSDFRVLPSHPFSSHNTAWLMGKKCVTCLSHRGGLHCARMRQLSNSQILPT